MSTSWQGTDREYLDLTHALDRYCVCEFAFMGTRESSCSVHSMLAEDQRALNGLLFSRRIVARLRNEEWLVESPALATRGGR